MIRFSVLGSGSSGNALLVASGSSRILIDDGLSLKQLRLRAACVGESLDDLQAVFVTHEHTDHVGGVGVLARAMPVPIFMTAATAERLPRAVGQVPRIETFEAGDQLAVDGMVLKSFSVSHDAADPVNYTVEIDGLKLGMAHDMGHPSQLVRSRLSGCHALIVESNHCPDMLRRGPYPAALQQRIRGRHGHLSNQLSSSLLAELVHDNLKLVVLAHISEDNNDPQLAHKMATTALRGCAATVHIAKQDEPTPLFEVS